MKDFLINDWGWPKILVLFLFVIPSILNFRISKVTTWYGENKEGLKEITRHPAWPKVKFIATLLVNLAILATIVRLIALSSDPMSKADVIFLVICCCILQSNLTSHLIYRRFITNHEDHLVDLWNSLGDVYDRTAEDYGILMAVSELALTASDPDQHGAPVQKAKARLKKVIDECRRNALDKVDS